MQAKILHTNVETVSDFSKTHRNFLMILVLDFITVTITATLLKITTSLFLLKCKNIFQRTKVIYYSYATELKKLFKIIIFENISYFFSQ